MRFQVRVEIFNVFNQVNYSNPNASFGAAAFGTITGAGVDAADPVGGEVVVLSRLPTPRPRDELQKSARITRS